MSDDKIKADIKSEKSDGLKAKKQFHGFKDEDDKISRLKSRNVKIADKASVPKITSSSFKKVTYNYSPKAFKIADRELTPKIASSTFKKNEADNQSDADSRKRLSDSKLDKRILPHHSRYVLRSEGTTGLKRVYLTVDDFINSRKKVTVTFNKGTPPKSNFKPRILWSKTQKEHVVIKTKQIGHFTKTEKVSLKKYYKMVDPSASGRIRRSLDSHINFSLFKMENAPKDFTMRGLHRASDGLNYRLNNEGLGERMASQALTLPRYSKNMYRAGKESYGLFKNTARQTWNTGRTTVEGSVNLFRESKKAMKSFRKFTRAKPSGAQWAKMTSKVLSNIGHKMRGMSVKALKSIALKLISLLPAGIGGIAVLSVVLILTVVLFASSGEVSAPLDDSDTILTFKTYCDNLQTQWYDNLNQIKESYETGKYDCGYNDTCTIHIQNDGTDANVSDTWIPLYILSLTYFNYNVNELVNTPSTGFDFPNSELSVWVNQMFDMMYPSDKSRMNIVQQTFSHTETDSKTGKITHDHNYIKTDIYIDIMTFDEALNHMEWHTNPSGFCQRTIEGWDKLSELQRNAYLSTISLETDQEVKDYYNEFIIALESNDGEDWKNQLNLSFLGNYDSLSSDDIDVLLSNAPEIDMTRQQFVDFVSGYCVPSGKIPYFWGGRSSPGWNNSWGYPALVTAAGSINTGTYQLYGLDCSGFVSWAFATAGKDIFGYGGTSSMWALTIPISSSEAKPGDLVFKQLPSSGGINHVGIFLGNYSNLGQFAHCTSSACGTTINNYSGFVFYRRPIVRFLDDIN